MKWSQLNPRSTLEILGQPAMFVLVKQLLFMEIVEKLTIWSQRQVIPDPNVLILMVDSIPHMVGKIVKITSIKGSTPTLLMGQKIMNIITSIK